jgi:alpha-galactosidase
LWAIQFLKDLACNKTATGQVYLFDRDKEAARNNETVGKRIFALNNASQRLTVRAIDDIQTALTGANLVILSIEPGNTSCRKSDLNLPEQYHILQTVGDTTGPGGIFRAKRALPIFFEYAHLIEQYCPTAWVINYSNPLSLCTAALYQAFPKIKALGCCHEVFHTENYIAELVAQWYHVPQPDRREIHMDITGVNHFTFATQVKWNGIDLMPQLKALAEKNQTYADYTSRALKRIKGEKWFDCDKLIALDFLRNYHALGAAGDRHLAEFVPWYLSDENNLHSLGVIRTPYSWRAQQAIEKRAKTFTDEELIDNQSKEEGVDIMMALLGERTLYTNINIPNNGQISYLPKGRIVETNGYLSNDSIVPSVANNPDSGLMSLIKQVSDEQGLILEAIWENDEDKLFEAFLLDPLVNIPVSSARKLFEEMKEGSRLVY